MDLLKKLKSEGWFLTSECLPIICDTNADTHLDDGVDLYVFSDVVKIYNHPETTIFKNTDECYFDFINKCWYFNEFTGGPEYTPIAWKYIRQF